MADRTVFRRASPSDYPAILELQSANYIHNLPEAERHQGFLSAEFNNEQVATIAEDLGIIVAITSGVLGGYLCALRNEFNHGSPVLAKMVESYNRVNFAGKPLSSFSAYIYGPVCIAREYRGSGLLRGLYEAQRRELKKLFEVGIAFVSRDNPHSLRAHIGGLGMIEVGDFHVGGKSYVILAFRLSR